MLTHALRRPAIPGPWRGPGLAFLGLVALCIGVYFQTAAAMVSIWVRSETFAHAFVVPPLVLWMVWRKRAELSALAPRPSPWMLPVLAVAALAWLLGDLMVANAVAQLAFTAMLVVAVPATLGWDVTRRLIFPLAFLFFAVPVGEALTPQMMQWTADFTVMALRASGIPVYREGLQFVVPTGNWSVVEACSGIRYLMASFMVGSLFAYLNYSSPRRRLAFAAVSIALPIVANWLRAYMIVMLGHLSNNRIATGADHLLYGWVFFGVVILGMFFIGARWAEPARPPRPADTVRRGGRSGSGAAPSWPVAAAAALLIVAPQLVLNGRPADSAVATRPVIAMPDTLAGGWTAVDEPPGEWKPVYVEPSAEALRTYRHGNLRVGVYIAYYRGQTPQSKLISSNNMLLASSDHRWNLLQQGSRDLALDDALGGSGALALSTGTLLASEVPGRVDRPRLETARYYWVGGRHTASDVGAKLYGAWQRLAGGADESAAVIVFARDVPNGSAAAALDAFVRANLVAIDNILRETAHARR